MSILKAFAPPAKVNLTLHVTGQRADGYHLLDSLVAFADVGDRVTVMPADKMSLEVTGPRAEGVPTDGSNLVMKAAEVFGVPVRILLSKHLPPRRGGSAAAARTRRRPSWQSPTFLRKSVCLMSRGGWGGLMRGSACCVRRRACPGLARWWSRWPGCPPRCMPFW